MIKYSLKYRKSEDKDILELRIRHIKTFICRDLQKIFLSI